MSVFAQIPNQGGWPVVFEDLSTNNPVIIDQVYPDSQEKQLITIVSGDCGLTDPAKIQCYSSTGLLLWENILGIMQLPHYIKPAIADIDNNGTKEIIVPHLSNTSPTEFSISIFNYDGSDYGNGWPLSGFTNLSNLSVGDIDNNGDLEIVVFQNINEVAVYHHNASMVEGWPYILSSDWNSNYSFPLIVDMDFDNQAEVVVTASRTNESFVGVLDNEGVMIDGWPKIVNKLIIHSTPVVGDFVEGNNSLEFVFSDDGVSTKTYMFDLYGNNCSGWPVITSSSLLSSSFENFYSQTFNFESNQYEVTGGIKGNGNSPIVVGDIDSDGSMEIIITGDNQMHFYNTDGTPFSLLPEIVLPDENLIFSPALVDIDNNGAIDIVCVQLERNVSTEEVFQQLYAYDFNGNILFNFPTIIKVFDVSDHPTLMYSRFHIPTIDDIDLDGDIDIGLIGFRHLVSYGPNNYGLINVLDVNSAYDFESVEFGDVVKNNWNNGTYCNYIDGTLSGSNIYYDNVRLRGDVNIPLGSSIKFISETKITADQGRIKVYGEVEAQEDSYFTSKEGESWGGLQIDNLNFDLGLNEVLFKNCRLSGKSKTLTVHNSKFENAAIKYSGGDLYVDNSLFNRSNLDAAKGNSRSSMVEITNSNFVDYEGETAIKITSYSNYIIDNCFIESNTKDGISIFNSGHLKGQKEITNNSILNNGWGNNGAGVKLYRSYADLTHDQLIEGNCYGVLSLDNSNVSILGDYSCNTHQKIINNQKHQILATQNSFPYQIKYNTIKDNNNITPLIYYITDETETLDVTHNEWGNGFDPLLDLYPSQLYEYLPYWECMTTSETGDAEAQYSSAKAYIEQENYSDAKTIYKQVVNTFPNSEYAKASLKELYQLEELESDNYNNLKSYYKTDPAILNVVELNKLADNLATYCDIKLENYPAAINWFEEVIQNPESIEDSIFAIIDLGYTYLLMEDGGKVSYTGNLLEHIPISVPQFEKNKDYLISLISGDILSEELSRNINDLKKGELLQNIPNPVIDNTQLWYKLDNDAEVTIKIYNSAGKLVRSYEEGTKEKGNHHIIVSANGLITGVYFYSIYVNGRRTDARKMMIQK